LRSFWSAATCRRFFARVNQESGDKSPHSKSKSLKYSRGPHAPADAHRHHAITAIPSFQFTQDRCGQFRPGASEWMAQRDCAAVHVNSVGIKLKHFDHRERLRGESFI